MNGTNRLYRSTSEAMVGGVAAGLANYFKTDPTIVRAAFVILTLLTGGAFIVPYLILWLLVPTAGSTATTPGGVVQENIDEVGAKLRGAWKVPTNGNPGNGGNGPTGSAPGNGNGTPGNSANFAASAETPGVAGSATNGGPGNGYAIQAQYRHRSGLLPLILIVFGVLVLFGHTGFFHVVFWGGFWPLVLIGLGMFLLARRGRWNV
jgi:phage shock protein PspC (stress-responsive transcriptional regulator)